MVAIEDGYSRAENKSDSLDRINQVLTIDDISRLKEMHHSLEAKGYDLANDVEHLACYLDKGNNPGCSVNIEGTEKKIYVKPEFRLDTPLGSSEREIIRSEDHPDYDPGSVGNDPAKQSIDLEQYHARSEFIDLEYHEGMKREEILDFELGLRQKDIRDHRLFLYEETQQEGADLYGKLMEYGNERDGIFLTIAVAHWLREQGSFFYDRAAEHYSDLGIDFSWGNNLEKAVVLETVNGDIRHYPISFDRFLENEALPAQVTLLKDLEEEGETELLDSASMAYRTEEERIRREGLDSGTGIFLLSDMLKTKRTG